MHIPLAWPCLQVARTCNTRERLVTSLLTMALASASPVIHVRDSEFGEWIRNSGKGSMLSRPGFRITP
jgi:hypothetical protein